MSQETAASIKTHMFLIIIMEYDVLLILGLVVLVYSLWLHNIFTYFHEFFDSIRYFVIALFIVKYYPYILQYLLLLLLLFLLLYVGIVSITKVVF